MDKRQKERLEIRLLPKGYYHLSTDGWRDGLLFNSDEQYKFGMASMALASLLFPVKIYVFELMPNHLHAVLSATGKNCLKLFYYLKRRINAQLLKDGNAPLPKDYWFKLTPIENVKSLEDHVIYVDRNAYEKNLCVPGGYRWGSDYLLFNDLGDVIRGKKVKEIPDSTLKKQIGSDIELPEDWEIHPDLGVLPRNFIQIEKVRSLFPSPKKYMTRLVKDYESFVHVAAELGETVDWSPEEVDDMVNTTVRSMYPHKWLRELTPDEKGQLAVTLRKRYGLTETVIASAIKLSEHLVVQFINAKDYRYK